MYFSSQFNQILFIFIFATSYVNASGLPALQQQAASLPVGSEEYQLNQEFTIKRVVDEIPENTQGQMVQMITYKKTSNQVQRGDWRGSGYIACTIMPQGHKPSGYLPGHISCETNVREWDLSKENFEKKLNQLAAEFESAKAASR